MSLQAYFGASQLIVLLTLFLQISSCSPTAGYSKRHGSNEPILEKRQGGLFSILGATGLGDNSIHPRLEIRELEKNVDQWTVYLLGLRQFQIVPQTDKLSYYQVAGIHGMPFISWDGVNQGPGGSGGYCAHGANIFLTWHRPYLALFEELLFLNARQAISDLENGPLKDRYSSALQTLRIPYWDSAAVPPSGQGSLPFSVQRRTLNIELPNGTTTIDNPLFSYQFRPLSSQDLGGAPWSVYPTTLRDPSSLDANAASRNDLIALQLDQNRPNLQSRVYNILAMQHDFVPMSNDRQPGDSLESVHDTIHNMVGSDGHMSYLAVSAFDPIFWLHHTNIDRYFAIWQTLNPNSYITRVSNPFATFTTAQNSFADTNTDLTPFHKNDNGQFWTSEEVRSTGTFAYTYPELVGFNGGDTSSLVSKVNALYGPNATPQFSQKRSALPEPIEQAQRSSQGIAGAASFTGQRQYIANIKVQKFGLDGSFNIYIFLGEQSASEGQTWAEAESFVGMTGILSQPLSSTTSKSEVEANGVVPLTPALEAHVKNLQLSDVNEDTVATYLKNNLKWRISKMNGEEFAVENAPGFQISVLWAEVEPAQSENEFPQVVSEYQVLVDATDGLPGGFGRGDSLR